MPSSENENIREIDQELVTKIRSKFSEIENLIEAMKSKLKKTTIDPRQGSEN